MVPNLIFLNSHQVIQLKDLFLLESSASIGTQDFTLFGAWGFLITNLYQHI